MAICTELDFHYLIILTVYYTTIGATEVNNFLFVLTIMIKRCKKKQNLNSFMDILLIFISTTQIVQKNPDQWQQVYSRYS